MAINIDQGFTKLEQVTGRTISGVEEDLGLMPDELLIELVENDISLCGLNTIAKKYSIKLTELVSWFEVDKGEQCLEQHKT